MHYICLVPDTKDHTEQMDLVAFGRPIEKLVGVTIIKLVALQAISRITLPGPVKALIS